MKFVKPLAKISIVMLFFLFPRPAWASLSQVSVTLSNPRLSYYANQNGTTALSSFVKIAKSGDTGTGPSKTNDDLFPNDKLLVGPGISAHLYNILDASSSANNLIQLTAPLASGDETGIVIATRSSILSASLTTVSQIPNGYFRIRVKAGSLDATNQDGIPDTTGFDFSKTTPTITCPNNTAGFTFQTGTATASGGLYCPSGYHCFECPYNGNGTLGTQFTNTGVGPFLINTNHAMINPAPTLAHTLGTADYYKVMIEQLDASHNFKDTSAVSITMVESVRITASVEPILNFTIAGLAGGTYCGSTLATIATTATSVPFGTLAISNFTDASQELKVATNAVNGYVVVASSSGALSLGGLGVTTIPNTTCDNSACTTTVEQEWVTPTVARGFGYTIAPNSCTGACSPAFAYNSCLGGLGTFCARQFASAFSPTWPELFSSTGIADNDTVYVCYRITIGASQAAGDYSTMVTYRATATF